MSEFQVLVREVEKVESHPNADRLDLVTLVGLGFQFISQKGLYEAGHRVIHFPVDSLIPVDLHEKLGVVGVLSGKEKNRVKTIRLRGEISQGLLSPIEALYPGGVLTLEIEHAITGGRAVNFDKIDLYDAEPESLDLAPFLGVEKYEAPVSFNAMKGAKTCTLPDGISIYDIESAQTKSKVLENYLETEMLFLEKLEGSNLSVVALLQDDGTHDIFVCSRRMRIDAAEGAKETNAFLSTVQTTGLLDDVKAYLSSNPETRVLRVLGELIGSGIQKNIYKFPSGKYDIRVFDIYLDGQYLPGEVFLGFVGAHLRVKTAPVLFVGNVAGFLAQSEADTLVEASTGQSALNPATLREGIVFRPHFESLRHDRLGRVIFKIRSPEYLLETGL